MCHHDKLQTLPQMQIHILVHDMLLDFYGHRD